MSTKITTSTAHLAAEKFDVSVPQLNRIACRMLARAESKGLEPEWAEDTGWGTSYRVAVGVNADGSKRMQSRTDRTLYIETFCEDVGGSIWFKLAVYRYGKSGTIHSSVDIGIANIGANSTRWHSYSANDAPHAALVRQIVGWK